LKIDSAVRHAAAETALLAAVFGSGDAADEVLAAACARHERLVIQQIIDRLQLTALGDNPRDLDVPTLVWFATELENGLSPESGRQPYTPDDGDVVQLTLTGVITAYDVQAPGGATMWEMDSAEGIVIPLSQEDFETLGVIKLAL
jgi:hypothetical protein